MDKFGTKIHILDLTSSLVSIREEDWGGSFLKAGTESETVRGKSEDTVSPGSQN